MDSGARGNSCIYFLFQVFNLTIFVLGLATLGIGMYLCIADKGFSWYSGSFLCMGVAVFLTGFIGWKARSSSSRLLFYSILTFLYFLCQSAFTIAILAYKDFDSVTGSESSANIVRYILLGCCGLLLLSFLSAFFYRRSLNNRKSVQISNSYKPLKSDPTPSDQKNSKYEEIRSRMNNFN